jgi:F0F1-type ATP synthase assembly protein I
LPFDKNKDDVFRILGIVGSFGFTTAGAVAGGYFLGSYLDRKLNTAPWLMLSFIMLGIAGSFIEFFKLIKKLSGENKNKQ